MNSPADRSLSEVVAGLLAPGKGILAADESHGTLEKRFAAVGIPCSAEMRRTYRELLFTTPGLNGFVSGVILFDETLRQSMHAGIPTADFLAGRGMIPGIKVDHGAHPLSNFPGETVTRGLDGLRERLAEYRLLGARFTKWRAVISPAGNLPSAACLRANSDALAQFAALSQEAGMVPIVEPEVLMDGPHSLARCEEATQEVLEGVFDSLRRHHVSVEHMLLKASMVLAGDGCPDQPPPAAVAAATLRCLRRTVPAAVPGVAFLSGGQSDEGATEHLRALCASPGAVWKLTFSFGRALQSAALHAWRGTSETIPAGQAALLARARANGLATLGDTSPKPVGPAS